MIIRPVGHSVAKSIPGVVVACRLVLFEEVRLKAGNSVRRCAVLGSLQVEHVAFDTEMILSILLCVLALPKKKRKDLHIGLAVWEI